MMLFGRSIPSAFIFNGLLLSTTSQAFTFLRLASSKIKYNDNHGLHVASRKRDGAMSRRRKGKNSSGNGFGNVTPIVEPDNSTSSLLSQTDSSTKKKNFLEEEEIYAFPALYDLAFGYRSYDDEVQFLLGRHKEHGLLESNNGEAFNIMELAAGPGRHCMAALMQDEYPVSSCTAVDLSMDMAQYSKEVAAQELSFATDAEDVVNLIGKYNYNVNDMRNLPEDDYPESTYDTIWILLGSMAHLITNQDVLDCFQSIHRTLKLGGTFILELAHPRETFTMVECTKNEWTVPLEDDNGNEDFGQLKIIWGDDDDPFDPIRQVRDFTVAMELSEKTSNEGGYITKQKVKQVVPMRLFTAQEIDALARLAGFKIVEMFGALDENVNVNSDEEAYRLVCVLRKE